MVRQLARNCENGSFARSHEQKKPRGDPRGLCNFTEYPEAVPLGAFSLCGLFELSWLSSRSLVHAGNDRICNVRAVLIDDVAVYTFDDFRTAFPVDWIRLEANHQRNAGLLAILPDNSLHFRVRVVVQAGFAIQQLLLGLAGLGGHGNALLLQFGFHLVAFCSALLVLLNDLLGFRLQLLLLGNYLRSQRFRLCLNLF